MTGMANPTEQGLRQIKAAIGFSGAESREGRQDFLVVLRLGEGALGEVTLPFLECRLVEDGWESRDRSFLQVSLFGIFQMRSSVARSRYLENRIRSCRFQSDRSLRSCSGMRIRRFRIPGMNPEVFWAGALFWLFMDSRVVVESYGANDSDPRRRGGARLSLVAGS